MPRRPLEDVRRRYVVIGGTMVEVDSELLRELVGGQGNLFGGYYPDTPRDTYDPLSDPLNDPFPEELR